MGDTRSGMEVRRAELVRRTPAFLSRDQTAVRQPSGLMAVYLPIDGVCMFLMFSTRARNRGLLLRALFLFRALVLLGVLGVCYLCSAPSPREPPRIGWFEPNLRRFGPCLRCGNSRSRPSWKITKEAQPSRGFLAGRCETASERGAGRAATEAGPDTSDPAGSAASKSSTAARHDRATCLGTMPTGTRRWDRQ